MNEDGVLAAISGDQQDEQTGATAGTQPTQPAPAPAQGHAGQPARFDAYTGQPLAPAQPPEAKPYKFDPYTGQQINDPNRELVEGEDYVSSYHETGRHDLPQRDTVNKTHVFAVPERAS